MTDKPDKVPGVAGKHFFRSILILLSGLPCLTSGQTGIPVYPDSMFSTYYLQRVSHFQTLLKTNRDIIFLGNSITDGAEWSELFGEPAIKNRGISGDITAGVLHRLQDIVQGHPKKIFLLIGINDLARNISPDSVVRNICLIADILHNAIPATKLYVQSLLPVNDAFSKFPAHVNKGEQVLYVNRKLRGLADAHLYTYIDLYSSFCAGDGKLKPVFTNDGLHLKGEAYLWWKHILYPYIFNLRDSVSLLPQPVKVKWVNELFPLYACRSIFLSDTVFNKQAGQLHDMLKGTDVALSGGPFSASLPYIFLQLQKKLSSEEAYRIEVTGGHIILQAAAPHGMFNALQTLRQLMRDDVAVNGCLIEDEPAFSWRGYMVDVGRNYQSVKQLEEQIAIMGRYKLNVFHLHLTEDIAWRLDSKRYPQLVDPENMLRDKGKYYTVSDIKELIAYCRDRFITFVPEIDMPGHSGAFTRAFGKDMQSDTGISIMHNIVQEICSTYDLPYLHIGGDEVNITNRHFLPDMKSFIQGMSSKVIGWVPGGNLPPGVMRQLWRGGGKPGDTHTGVNIDSRCLYINHMDPLESVVTIFNRRIGDRIREDSNMIGGTLCVWNDRRANNEKDILRMNPVYPAMLAFAERSWCGGGGHTVTTEIGAPASPEAKAFAAFEKRLMDQRNLYFRELPFPYQPQSELVWKMYGPYANHGKLTAQFSPEQDTVKQEDPALMRVGGTIILRHWWFPLITGAIAAPQENTTWYAATRLYASEAEARNCWIGFNNLSRSTATIGPVRGSWDNRYSAVWVNGQPIPPPDWQQAGKKIDLEVPLVDEGYEYREPTRIFLHKGWNSVLVKLPVGSFQGSDWQNPVKWMFTFLPLQE